MARGRESSDQEMGLKSVVGLFSLLSSPSLTIRLLVTSNSVCSREDVRGKAVYYGAVMRRISHQVVQFSIIIASETLFLIVSSIRVWVCAVHPLLFWMLMSHGENKDAIVS